MGAEILVDSLSTLGHISEPFIEDHLRQAQEGARKNLTVCLTYSFNAVK